MKGRAHPEGNQHSAKDRGGPELYLTSGDEPFDSSYCAQCLTNSYLNNMESGIAFFSLNVLFLVVPEGKIGDSDQSTRSHQTR